MYSDEMERGEHDPMHSDEMDLIKGSSDTCAMEIEVQPMPPQPSTAVMEPNATEEEVKAIPQQGDLILADPEVDSRQYFRGKQTRERLLARVGLLGEGSRFTLGIPEDGGSEEGTVVPLSPDPAEETPEIIRLRA